MSAPLYIHDVVLLFVLPLLFVLQQLIPGEKTKQYIFCILLLGLVGISLESVFTTVFVGVLALLVVRKRFSLLFLGIILGSASLLWNYIYDFQLQQLEVDLLGKHLNKRMFLCWTGILFFYSTRKEVIQKQLQESELKIKWGLLKLILLLVFMRFFLIAPFMEWTSLGIDSGFTLNFFQAWVLLFSNGLLHVLLLTSFILTLFAVVSFGTGITVSNCWEFVNAELRRVVAKRGALFFIILILVCLLTLMSGTEWYALVVIGCLMLSFVAFQRFILKRKLLLLLWVSLLVLCFSVDSFTQFKHLTAGLASIQTIFMYYNELYILHAFNSNIYLAIVLVSLAFVLLKRLKFFFKKELNPVWLIVAAIAVPIVGFLL